MCMTVYQFDLANVRNEADSIEKEIHFNLSLYGGKRWDEALWRFFQPVATVHTDDLDHAFEVMNLWNDEELVERHRPTRSLSVGDILKRGEKFYMVDGFGFSEISVAA